MYDHHYNYVMNHYPKAKLLFTDTDRYSYINLYIHIYIYVYLSSFCYLLETERNIYDDMKNTNIFDFSNYPEKDKRFDVKNKLVPGNIF